MDPYLHIPDLCDLFHIHLPFTTFYGMRRVILNGLPDLQHYKTQIILPFIPIHIRALKLSKDSRVIYYLFVSALKINTKYIDKWKTEPNLFDESQLAKAVHYFFTYFQDVSLRWFQYRLSHRILATNDFLCEIKIKQTDLCAFCQTKIETLLHLFVACEVVENIWNNLILQLHLS